LTRFRIFALFAVVAALALVFAACGGSSGSEDPQQVIDSASFEGIESASVDLSLNVISEGKEGGNLKVSASGPFQSKGNENLPELAISAKAKGTAKGEPVDIEGGLVLLSDRAYVNYKGTEYEVDPTTFGFVKSAFEQAQEKGNGEGKADVSACQEAASGLNVANFVEGLKNEGSADVGGTSTTKISGNLDAGAAIDALIKLTENPACKSQLEAAGPLPLGELKKARSELTSALKKAHVAVYVGDDDIIRRVAFEATVEPTSSLREKVEIDFDLSLSNVNQDQTISAPSGAKPIEKLFLKLGVNPIELLEGGSGGFEHLLEAVLGDNGLNGLGASGGSSQQAYLNCLKEAETPADLQNCASLLQ
jgi:hypothetical protein